MLILFMLAVAYAADDCTKARDNVLVADPSKLKEAQAQYRECIKRHTSPGTIQECQKIVHQKFSGADEKTRQDRYHDCISRHHSIENEPSMDGECVKIGEQKMSMISQLEQDAEKQYNECLLKQEKEKTMGENDGNSDFGGDCIRSKNDFHLDPKVKQAEADYDDCLVRHRQLADDKTHAEIDAQEKAAEEEAEKEQRRHQEEEEEEKRRREDEEKRRREVEEKRRREEEERRHHDEEVNNLRHREESRRHEEEEREHQREEEERDHHKEEDDEPLKHREEEEEERRRHREEEERRHREDEERRRHHEEEEHARHHDDEDEERRHRDEERRRAEERHREDEKLRHHDEEERRRHEEDEERRRHADKVLEEERHRSSEDETSAHRTGDDIVGNCLHLLPRYGSSHESLGSVKDERVAEEAFAKCVHDHREESERVKEHDASPNVREDSYEDCLRHYDTQKPPPDAEADFNECMRRHRIRGEIRIGYKYVDNHPLDDIKEKEIDEYRQHHSAEKEPEGGKSLKLSRKSEDAVTVEGKKPKENVNNILDYLTKAEVASALDGSIIHSNVTQVVAEGAELNDIYTGQRGAHHKPQGAVVRKAYSNNTKDKFGATRTLLHILGGAKSAGPPMDLPDPEKIQAMGEFITARVPPTKFGRSGSRSNKVRTKLWNYLKQHLKSETKRSRSEEHSKGNKTMVATHKRKHVTKPVKTKKVN